MSIPPSRLLPLSGFHYVNNHPGCPRECCVFSLVPNILNVSNKYAEFGSLRNIGGISLASERRRPMGTREA